MKTLDQRISEQEGKLRQLKARQQKLLAQQRSVESKKLRAHDTRRKILLGAMLLDRMSKNESVKQQTLTELGHWLSRNDDRELFALPELPVQTIMSAS